MTDMKTRAKQIVGYEFPPLTYTYTERDACLYALGVGAPADWRDQDELKFVYELSTKGFAPLPTFSVLYPSRMIDVLMGGRIGEVEFNPMMIVHGEQYLEIRKPIPTAATITCYPKVSQVYDKGSGMLIVTETRCCDESGAEVTLNQSSMFIRGLGGYGGERGTSSDANVPPDRPADAVDEYHVLPQQALLYRLSGDINPLHADPQMAAIGGFDRPILHGLCTFGIAGRAVLRHFCGNDPARFRSIRVRFSKHVFPGETVRTEMWKVADDRVLFRTTVVERGEVALSHAAVELNSA
jgi:3-hydroxyacyl-CoA dehydrogenase/3a,7a,12a-trihydroxy-5b-cholest-24-enoyl-CoA hydratase